MNLLRSNSFSPGNPKTKNILVLVATQQQTKQNDGNGDIQQIIKVHACNVKFKFVEQFKFPSHDIHSLVFSLYFARATAAV